MPTIQQPKRAPEYVPGKKNVVTGIVPAQLYAVSFVGGDSQKSMALVLVFGRDNEDGGPGVFVLADENEMSNQLKIATDTVKKGVRAYLARQQEPTAEEVPESATNLLGAPKQIDLGEVGKVSEGSVDIKNLNLG